jgi:lipopolysaccharide biosynthesis protein
VSARAHALTVAYYLPQFHCIPENDEWWGKGFTEWTNVGKAAPQYSGHDQPRRPAELGEYDLSNVEVMHRQASLAREHDVDAFCFYFYWFDGHRLLEKPVDNYLESGPDFPFCLSWANENWTRRWDGKEHEVLVGQNYSERTAEEVFESFIPYLSDARYLRHDGALVVLVHRIDHIPDSVSFLARWREIARERGLGELKIIASETRVGLDPSSYGVDAIAEFPPVGSNTLASAQLLPVAGLQKSFSGRLMSYKRMARRFMRRRNPRYIRYSGVAPGWDNSARRGAKATIYVGHSPEIYRQWLALARAREESRTGGPGIVFVNAWNEWAEGAYLEPDDTWGDAFLKATRRQAGTGSDRITVAAGLPSLGWVRSLLLASFGTGVSFLRTVRKGPQ